MQRPGRGTAVLGRAVGNSAEPGTPVSLRFVFYGPDGKVASRTVKLSALEPGESDFFEVTIDRLVKAYRYELASGGESTSNPDPDGVLPR